MGDSSDEDLNSDDEVIDLSALWRDPPFLHEPETEDPDLPDVSSAEDDSPPRVIELTPYVPTPEGAPDPLENLMNEITDMSRRVTNARMARQRILDLGRPVVYRTRPMEEEVTTSSNPSPQVMWSAAGGPPRYNEDQIMEDEQIPYRFNQFRHMVAGTSQMPPRWARGRQTFSVLTPQPNIGRMVDSSTQDEDETQFVDAVESESRFILPAAIEEREKEIEVEEGELADRAMFVSNLMLSSLTKSKETRSKFPMQSTSSANKGANKNTVDKAKEDSKVDDSEDSKKETVGPNSGAPTGHKFIKN